MTEPLISTGSIGFRERCESPQYFLVKLRRGTSYTYIASGGETADRDAALQIESHREAHERSMAMLRGDVDGTEVEIVTR